MSSGVAKIFGLGLVIGLGVPSGDARASVRPGPVAAPLASTPDARIEVDVEASFSNAETTDRWIEERATRALDALEPGLEAGDVIRILVRGGAFDYRISLVLLRQGEPLPAERQPSELECACGSDEMLEKVAEAIGAGARVLGEVAEQEREEAARREEELWREENERPVPPEPEQPRYRPSKVGRAGIGLLAAGGVVVLSGIIMTSQPPQSAYRWQPHDRDWSAAGATMIGIGVTTVVAGLTALIVDVVRCRRDRRSGGATATGWAIGRNRWATQRAGGGW